MADGLEDAIAPPNDPRLGKAIGRLQPEGELDALARWLADPDPHLGAPLASSSRRITVARLMPKRSATSFWVRPRL